MACLMTASKTPAINRINSFLASPGFVVAAMLLTAASNILGLELVTYSIFTAVALYVCLLGADLLPMMPLFVFCYLAPSVHNNPGRNEASLFSVAGGGIFLLCLGAVLLGGVIYRVIRDRRRFLDRKYPLLSGMVILLGAYLLSGIGSAAYPDAALKNILFALIQGCSIVLPYLLFSGGVNWRRAPRDYLAWIGFSTGVLLVCQILWIYISGNVVVDGIIHRKAIFTGWGMYNNMGGMLAMMIPFAFYLASKYRKGWIGTVVGSGFLICTLLTCSRSSILAAVLIYGICVLLMLHYARNRKDNTIALITVAAIALCAVLLFHRQLLRLFSDLIGRGMDPSSRDTIFSEGLKLFLQAPVFGSSFYSPGYLPWDWSTVESFSSLFPPRWHNTFIQLAASCGIAGLGAYVLHRVQTVKIFLSGYSKERTFIACSLAVLLLTSLFDCHFFNIGPTLFYAMMLSFAENCSGAKPLMRK